MSLSSYLFSTPQNGPYLTTLAGVFGLLFTLGVIVWLVARRSGLQAVRRRLLRLRSLTLWTGGLGGLYVVGRYEQAQFLTLRIWLVTLLLIAGWLFLLWLISLRSLGHDKVEERQRRRKQTYFQPRRHGHRRR